MNFVDGIKKIAVGRTGSLPVQLLRYLAAGAIAFLADFALLWFFTEQLHVNYIVSSIIGYCVGLVISYLLSIYWVFDQRRMDNRTAELATFILIGLVGIGLTSLLMWLLTDKAGIYYLLSKIITTILVFVWNFSAKKIILFTSGKNR